MDTSLNLIMKQMSRTVIFFGNERLATGVSTTAPTLQALITNGYKVAAVVSNYEKGQSRNPRDLEIATIAANHGIPVLLPEKLSDVAPELSSYAASAGILVAYGKIVPQHIIDIFPHGIINIHPSLLPLHRGPTPVESIILSGETQSGVSLMKLVQAMDAGPIYAQKVMNIRDTESKQMLSNQLLQTGKNMLVEHLPAILDGTLIPHPQDDTRASYDRLITKQDGIIQWHKPAVSIEREIRAYQEWPKSRTNIAGKEIIITDASVIALNGMPGKLHFADKKLVICCGEQALQINKLKPAGKNEMTGEAFIAGHQSLLQLS
jgi:methionyl-tRNA formyltransferase